MDGLDFEKACRSLRRRDAVMRKAINLVGPCRFEVDRNGFRMLVRSIVGQQLSTSAAATIWRRFIELNGGRRVSAGKTLLFSAAQLRAIGFSAAKCRAVLSIAKSVIDGDVHLAELSRLSDEQVTAELIKLRGVGPWTAQMYLMFSLGRADVFPTGDLGIVNAVTALYKFNNRATETEMLEIAESWRPYRTIASWYLWQALDIVRQGDW
ncbi:MAG TPA: DNA-3-methyladenine glycosylase 2 family protein [Planctomycetes bacterium]|nr:DNA-3-methyladenine glycosylase 2 family protein [Planctomycetaceae bacterium]HIN54617.1 DNA-3-methyladenine glycosylase 2 family protein [Planctomycetota bacterium]